MLHRSSTVPRTTYLAWLVLAGCDGVFSEQLASSDGGLGSVIAAPECDQVAETTSDGHHHPGEDCLMCHHQGGEGPPYTFAGTAYTRSGGATPAAGVTIHMIDVDGNDVIVVTQANGNFWSTDLVSFPVVAFGSLCPAVTPMLSAIGDNDGSCNTAGCHTSGFRIHVP